MSRSKDKEIDKLVSGSWKRSLSLLNLTLSSSAKYAGMKVESFFVSSQADKDSKIKEFWKQQALDLVDEFSKLKGSFMKAGQMLSVYGEHLLPNEVNEILKTLQSDSKPVVWKEMKRVIDSQISPEKRALLEINETPVAAASMGQVYKAIHKQTGEILALKVQYPGMDKSIESDLAALKKLLLLFKFLPLDQDGLEEVFKEIRMMLHYEADYDREMETLLQYREWLKDDPRFLIPKVYPEFSGKRLLAMSFESGVPVDSEEVRSLSQERKNRLGSSIMELMFKEIFEWRTVQTDPHFGNFRVKLRTSPETLDQMILFDFGAMRKFPRTYIEPFAALVLSALNQNPERNKKAGMKLGFLKENDAPNVFDLFCKICYMAIEPFEESYDSKIYDGSYLGDKAYDWGNSDLMTRLSHLTKDAIFTFKLRPPPREAIFLDRKMVGSFVLLSKLGLRMGPRGLIQKYLNPYES